MINNDILRRIRYIFDFSDTQMVALFALADTAVNQAELIDWLRKEEDPAFKAMQDIKLAGFLNGLITEKRGKKDGPQPPLEQQLTNNIIFNKLKIALELKAEDVLDIMQLSGLRISKHELSAFFRKPDHKHFRECKDQILRNFLKGLQIKYRGESDEELAEVQ
jgi:uncharacterized protein YehS (DUF1456 family)